MEGRSFSRLFERRDKVFLFGGIFMRNLRQMQKRPCKRMALSIGALLENLGEFIY
jgi:hypothetical protein